MLAGLIFGLIPAIRMASFNLLTTLRMGTRALDGKGARFGLSMMLVVAQIGLSVMVITAAGLMLHSLYKLSQVDPGFKTEHIVTAEVSLDGAACKDKGRCRAFFEALLATLKVFRRRGVALTDTLPLRGK